MIKKNNSVKNKKENNETKVVLSENSEDKVFDAGENQDNTEISSQLETSAEEFQKVDFDAKIIEERLEEAKKSQNPKKRRRSRIINTIFLLVNILLMVSIINSFLSTLDEDINGLFNRMVAQGDKLWWLAIGLLLYVIFIFTETCVFTSLMKGTTGKRRPYLSYRLATLGKYYDNITPLSVGGQPFQIVMLTQDGLSPGIATSLPIIKLIIYNIVYTLAIVLSFVFGLPLVSAGLEGLNRFLMIIFIAIGILGLIITVLSSVLFILIGNGKIIGRGLARWLVKVGYTFRIVKDYRKSYNKIMMQVREYQSSMDFLKKNKMVMVKSVVYSLIEIIAYFSIPVVCILAFSSTVELTFHFYFVTIVKFLICQMAAVILPLPGGTGMMEIGFILSFGSPDILGDNVFIALLVWRIISYYLLLLHGFVQTVIDSVVRSVKNRKLEKEEQALANIDKK